MTPNNEAGGAAEEADALAAGDSIAILDGLAAQLDVEGKELQAVRYRERALILRSERFGLMAPEVSDACEQLVLAANTVAMRQLRDGEHAVALELLSKAEMLTERKGCLAGRPSRVKLRAVTFNNFGCFYKLRAKMHTALQHATLPLHTTAVATHPT